MNLRMLSKLSFFNTYFRGRKTLSIFFTLLLGSFFVLSSGTVTKEPTVSRPFPLPISSNRANNAKVLQLDRIIRSNQSLLTIQVNLDLLSTSDSFSLVAIESFKSAAFSQSLLNLKLSQQDAPPGKLIATIFLRNINKQFGSDGPTLRAVTQSNQGLLDLIVFKNKRITLKQKGETIFEHSWSREIGSIEHATSIVVDTTDTKVVTGELRSITGVPILQVWSYWLLVLCGFFLVVYAGYSISRKLRFFLGISQIDTAILNPLYLGVFISAGVTSLTFFVLSKFQFQERGYFSRNGLQLSSYASLSDFKELLQISTSQRPYSVLHTNYPPLALLLIREANSLFGDRLYLLICLVAFLSCVVVSCTILNQLQLFSSQLLIASLSILCYPVVFAVDRGNTDLLVLAAVTLFVLLIKMQKWTLAAMCLGGLIAFKLYPILFLLCFIKRPRQFRNIATTVLLALVFTIFSAGLLPEKGISECFLFLKELMTGRGLLLSQNSLVGFNSSLNSWWHLVGHFSWLNGTNSQELSNIGSLISLSVFMLAVITTLCWLALKTRPLSVVYFVTFNAVLLFSDLSFDYRLVLFLPGILLIVLDQQMDEIPYSNFLLMTVVSAFMISSHPIYFFEGTPLSVGHLLNAPILMISSIVILSRTTRHF